LNLIARYIFRETVASTGIVMVVLLLIFMTSQFADTLGDAAADLLPPDAVFRVFGLQFLQYLSLLAPIGLLLGILLALARLNRDSEMSALAACGIGPGRLLRPIGLLSILSAALVGWLALIKAPQASLAIQEIRFRAQEEIELGALTPGQFTAADGDAMVVYADQGNDDTWQGVFIQSETDEGIVVVLADEGRRVVDAQTGDLALSLHAGHLYEGDAGKSNFYVTEFASGEFPVPVDEATFDPVIESRPTASLLADVDPVARAELQWRIAAPVSMLLLALLAVPLGRSSPREGKYARVGLGLLIYMIYWNSLAIARVWVEREVVPPWLGVWWVHAAVLGLAVLLLMRQSGFGIRQQQPLVERHEPTL
jgi:lipopolysaccharide export system permease protein